MKCKSHNTCEYKGHTFKHFHDIPQDLSGCDKKCTCAYGKVTCNDICRPIPPLPPADLPCPPSNVILTTPPGETCCKTYFCSTSPISTGKKNIFFSIFE